MKDWEYVSGDSVDLFLDTTVIACDGTVVHRVLLVIGLVIGFGLMIGFACVFGLLVIGRVCDCIYL